MPQSSIFFSTSPALFERSFTKNPKSKPTPSSIIQGLQHSVLKLGGKVLFVSMLVLVLDIPV